VWPYAFKRKLLRSTFKDVYSTVGGFESADEIASDHSESYWAVLHFSAVYYAVKWSMWKKSFKCDLSNENNWGKNY